MSKTPIEIDRLSFQQENGTNRWFSAISTSYSDGISITLKEYLGKEDYRTDRGISFDIDIEDLDNVIKGLKDIKRATNKYLRKQEKKKNERS